jgi:putative flippase GtrA
LTETQELQTPAESSHSTQNAATHHLHAWNSTLWQFLRYCLVGGANTFIDLLTLNILLLRFPTNNVQVLVLYNSLAYTGGALSSFFLNKYWTFRRTQRTTAREVIRFAISLFLEILYSGVLVWLAGRALQPLIANVTLWGNASKIIAVIVGTLISYTFMRFWIFAGGSQQPPAKQETVNQAAAAPDDHPASTEAAHAHQHNEKERTS